MTKRVRVELKEGGSFLGSPHEVVTQMREDCRHRSSTNIGYKFAYAKRAMHYYGKQIRWIGDMNFIYDLVALGEITELSVDCTSLGF